MKPLAGFAALTLLVLAYVNITETGIARGLWAWTLTVLSVTGAVMLVLGWALRSQRLAEWGLLCAAGVWTIRAMLAILLGSSYSYSWALSLCWAGMAGSAFLLERADENGRPISVVR